MRLENLETLLSIVETGSFSETARRLNLTQPAVTQQVKAIEEELRTQILNRSAASVVCTPAGYEILDEIKEIVRRCRLLEEHAQRLGDASRATLRLAAGYSVGEYLAPKLLFEFKRKYPDRQVSLATGSYHAVIRLVLSGEAHAGIVGLIPPQFQRGLSVKELWEETYLLLAPPSHPILSAPDPWKALRSCQFILREVGSSSRITVETALAEHGIWDSLAQPMVMGSNAGITSAIRNGLGIGFVPEGIAMQDLKSKLVAEVRVPKLHVARTLYLVQPITEANSSADHFLRFLRETRPSAQVT
jgi:DNA-binding transcriptional LysR family regulator